MRTGSEDSLLVSFSVSVYRLLVGAYPQAFRQEYGAHMLQLFRDYSRRQYRQKGVTGMLALWPVTLFDFARSVVAEHLQKETIMNRQLFIRLSGWALMSGGVVFYLGVIGFSFEDTRYYITFRELRDFFAALQFGLFLGPMLIGVGMLGLLVRFGNEVGISGKVALAAGAFGGLLAAPLAYLFEALLPVGFLGGDSIWPIIFFGLLSLMFLGLGLYGLLAWRRRVMPRWNVLPALVVLAALLFPTLWLLDRWGWSEIIQNSTILNTMFVVLVVFAVSAVSIVLLGYQLQAIDSKEPAIA